MSSGQNPYSQGPSQESGYGGGGYGQGTAGGNGYAQEQASRQPTVLSQQDFLNRVQNLRNDIKALTGDIDYIGQLHQRTLSTTDQEATQQLEHYVAQTQIRNTAIKDGIKGLERDLLKTNDSSRNTKKTQLESLKTFFKSELDKYQSIERDYQQRYREQIARQYRIVNPDASEDEVRQATEADWNNEGVFQTAVSLRTNRTGHAASLLGNVRARHNELQRIEQTLSELAILFQELAAMVEQQENVVVSAEVNAENTVQNIEKGNEQVSQGIEHARRTRRLKWWCFLICFLIVLAIALGVGLGVALTNKN
ncbi:t-snare, syntaxin [Trichoderma reesei QM6a]|uniref:T-snare, syntaxin n=1 Tax=Hypocrea jecorina (strain QM6a) TaxID=431241 RepID=G0RLT1_HYPJQ|nr:t-snare, syntaxin [Trichoderma reesei QM6a]EGR47670.1 t-snare, syntaxin [Trichoderma reesei QM6a]